MSTHSRPAGIIRIDMNTISNPIPKPLKLQMGALIDLNTREDLSEEVRDIWGAERMRESWSGLVRPTSQGLCAHHRCFDVFNRSYNTEPQYTELMAKMRVGKMKGSPYAEA